MLSYLDFSIISAFHFSALCLLCHSVVEALEKYNLTNAFEVQYKENSLKMWP